RPARTRGGWATNPSDPAATRRVATLARSPTMIPELIPRADIDSSAIGSRGETGHVQRRTSGIASLDDLLAGGLGLGDNVGWLGESRADVDTPAAAFRAPDDAPRHLVCFGPARFEVPAGVTVHRVPTGRRAPSIDDLEALVVGDHLGDGTRLVVDGLDDLLARFGASETVAFYRRCCPRLLDLGAIATWT